MSIARRRKILSGRWRGMNITALLTAMTLGLGFTELAQADTGLDFQSRDDAPTTAYIAFEFADVKNNGLPAYGASGAGATYIHKIKPRQQDAYYVTFWWTQGDGGFGGLSDTIFYGAHPYPNDGVSEPPLTNVSEHNWELATKNNDWQATKAGTNKAVVKDVWYTQALRVVRTSSTSKTFTFYTSLPSVADADVIEVVVTGDYGETLPANTKLIYGDSPWWDGGYQHERLSGVIRHIKVFNEPLSEADILLEAASDSLVTTAGQNGIWYMNINPTPDDISDKSGQGNNPAWAEATKANLYSSSSGPQTPLPPVIQDVQ